MAGNSQNRGKDLNPSTYCNMSTAGHSTATSQQGSDSLRSYSVQIDTLPLYKGFSFRNRLARLIWMLAYYVLFRIPLPGDIGRIFRIVVLRTFGAKASWGSEIHRTVKIWQPWNLEIGAKSVLAPSVRCYNPAPVRIGRKSIISQGTYLCGGGHRIDSVMLPFVSGEIIIKDFVWVCADSFVKYGVTLGEGAVVGATSSVFRSVDPWTVVGGNPAHYIRKRRIKDNELM